MDNSMEIQDIRTRLEQFQANKDPRLKNTMSVPEMRRDVAHVQAGLVILAQPAVPHRLDVLGQTVVPGADLHILGVAHHGDVPLGADGEGSSLHIFARCLSATIFRPQRQHDWSMIL